MPPVKGLPKMLDLQQKKLSDFRCTDTEKILNDYGDFLVLIQQYLDDISILLKYVTNLSLYSDYLQLQKLLDKYRLMAQNAEQNLRTNFGKTFETPDQALCRLIHMDKSKNEEESAIVKIMSSRVLEDMRTMYDLTSKCVGANCFVAALNKIKNVDFDNSSKSCLYLQAQ